MANGGLREGQLQGEVLDGAAAKGGRTTADRARRRSAAITAPENTPSIRVLEKLGFREAGTVQFPDDGDLCAHFLLDL